MLPARHLSQRTAFDDRKPLPAPKNRTRRNIHWPRKSKGPTSDDARDATPLRSPEVEEPSLVEQLFPEISKRNEEPEASREVPRVPLPKVNPDATAQPRPTPSKSNRTDRSWGAQQLEAEMAAAGPGTSVLVLRNASPNLTEEDFRRLVPQGRHLEGWRLEQGDILKVIPGRDLASLEQQNTYYLLFSSALNAFTYQGHVQRIHNLAAVHTPTSTSSPIPPPPGYMIEGLDAHAAIEAYTLVPPTQKLELRQLKPPLSPVMQSLVSNQGWKSINSRQDKMPFEVRLAMEGPQLGPSVVRHILMETGRARGLSWNGGEELNMKVTRWTPQLMPSPIQNDENALNALKDRTEEEQMRIDVMRHTQSSQDPKYAELKRRTPPEVYILGFHTERAAQSFVTYWHRRPLEMDQPEDAAEWDTSPVVNVSMLW
ncbi:hypothetical protein M409DRAFT_66180 [Zasmidium cellare ATCC 36951]|uniref:Uncharacterized protein n=1 Tax=Zasmidium cellare ATCC 36951 TaxID=1080233 RepID=A0A6A6CLN6_ZASCE|nr:uncharacterized protein M409DRAFT_66180 [Zasmidium cellare ATCC 36951]KAF2167118.1 hypothetical protein M409DRAFT_66180 [Zasmidium cellare ATCC 36951]